MPGPRHRRRVSAGELEPFPSQSSTLRRGTHPAVSCRAVRCIRPSPTRAESHALFSHAGWRPFARPCVGPMKDGRSQHSPAASSARATAAKPSEPRSEASGPLPRRHPTGPPGRGRRRIAPRGFPALGEPTVLTRVRASDGTVPGGGPTNHEASVLIGRRGSPLIRPHDERPASDRSGRARWEDHLGFEGSMG